MNKNSDAEYLDPSALELQEHLSKEQLQKLVVSDAFLNRKVPIDVARPKANFIDLMQWVEEIFKPALKDQSNLNRFVHNRVIVDGQFLRFCEENKITVECLYKDSLISWKTEHNYEKFFAQGVFLIKARGVEFLHAALFHKGNQNEDEVSFFVIVSQDNYEAYIKLRNQFDDWVQQ